MKFTLTRFTSTALLLCLSLAVGCGQGQSANTESNAEVVSVDTGPEFGDGPPIVRLYKARGVLITNQLLYVLHKTHLDIYDLALYEEELEAGTAIVTGEDILDKDSILDRDTKPDSLLALEGTEWSNSETIAAKGNHIYLGGRQIHVFDNADRLAPTFVKSISTNARRYLKVFDNYMIASGRTSEGAELFDVSDPANPILINRFAIGLVNGIALIEGNYIYCALVDKTLHIYDISSPASGISQVAVVPLTVSPSNMVSANGALFITGSETATEESVSNPGLGLEEDQEVVQLATIFQAFSIADPLNPTLVDAIDLGVAGYGRSLGAYNHCVATGKYSGYGLWPNDIELIDVSDSANLVSIDTINWGGATYSGFTYDIAMNEDYLFAGSETHVLAGHSSCSAWETIDQEEKQVGTSP